MTNPPADLPDAPPKFSPRPTRPSWRRHALLLVAVAALTMNGASHSTIPSAERIKRQQQLTNMTAQEREVLQRQLAAWKQLPEDERQKFREFHAALVKQPELRETFDSYSSWLSTLSRPDRDELRDAKNATDRVVRMQVMIERQTEMGLPFLQRPLPKHGDKNLLTKEDFDAAMHSMEATIRARVPDRQRHEMQQLGDKHGLKQGMMLGVLLRELVAGTPAASTALDSALAEVKDPPTAELLEKMKTVEVRRMRMYQLLLRTLAADIGDRRPDPKTDAGRQVLEEAYGKLEPKIQDEMGKFPPDEFWAMLQRRYGYVQNIAMIPPGLQHIIQVPPENLPQVIERMKFAGAPRPRAVLIQPQRPGGGEPPREGDRPRREERKPDGDRPPGDGF